MSVFITAAVLKCDAYIYAVSLHDSTM